MFSSISKLFNALSTLTSALLNLSETVRGIDDGLKRQVALVGEPEHLVALPPAEEPAPEANGKARKRVTA